jgi:hypothetical protein
MGKIKGWSRWQQQETRRVPAVWVQTPKKVKKLDNIDFYSIAVSAKSFHTVAVHDTVSGYRIRTGYTGDNYEFPKTREEWFEKKEIQGGRPWLGAPGSDERGFFQNKKRAKKAAIELLKTHPDGLIPEKHVYRRSGNPEGTR